MSEKTKLDDILIKLLFELFLVPFEIDFEGHGGFYGILLQKDNKNHIKTT